MRVDRDGLVRGVGSESLAYIECLVALLAQQVQGSPREVSINKKTHRRDRSDRQGVMLFLLDQLARVGQSSPDVFHGDGVFLGDFLQGHAPCQASDDAGHGHAGATDHGLTVLDPGVHDNPVSPVSHAFALRFHSPMVIVSSPALSRQTQDSGAPVQGEAVEPANTAWWSGALQSGA